jgi:hypothetical protein
VVTQPIIKIEIQSRKAEIGLIGIGKIEEDEDTTRIEFTIGRTLI